MVRSGGDCSDFTYCSLSPSFWVCNTQFKWSGRDRGAGKGADHGLWCRLCTSRLEWKVTLIRSCIKCAIRSQRKPHEARYLIYYRRLVVRGHDDPMQGRGHCGAGLQLKHECRCRVFQPCHYALAATVQPLRASNQSKASVPQQ